MRSSNSCVLKRNCNLNVNFAQTIAEEINVELIQECKSFEIGNFSNALQEKLIKLRREIRREVVGIKRDGCAPLFFACKRGNVEMVEYLISICDADMEQHGIYEMQGDSSSHVVTPLWCAAVSGKMSVVKCLIRLGAQVNALSNTGSTPVRSACFMTYIDIVQYLVEHGADVNKKNYNGGTCLINSVQSVKLCAYLIGKGADVNWKDIQLKTALHYAVQEDRLATADLLLKHGADPFAKSEYGDDALQIACLKGSQECFDLLKSRVPYSAERLADAHELIGSTFLEEYNEVRVALLHWKIAHHIRLKTMNYIPKRPIMPLRSAYENAIEFSSFQELETISIDIDAMRIQSLLICERVAGTFHKDTLFRLMYRGASFADSLRFQRCIDLWRYVLHLRISQNTIFFSESCFTAQAIIRLMLDLQEKYIGIEPNVIYDTDSPCFDDVYYVFELLSQNITEARPLLDIRPVYRRQQENFDRMLKYVTHLIYLLIVTAKTTTQNQLVADRVKSLVLSNVRSACTKDTLLHLCVSRLNVIKNGYFADDNIRVIFPNLDVVLLLIKCGADINAQNGSKSTPLHVASIPYNYDSNIVHTLLKNGAHLDQPNRNNDRPLFMIHTNSDGNIPLMNYTTLKCLAATVIAKYKIPFKNQIPKTLEKFVRLHQP